MSGPMVLVGFMMAGMEVGMEVGIGAGMGVTREVIRGVTDSFRGMRFFGCSSGKLVPVRAVLCSGVVFTETLSVGLLVCSS